ncbi:hypothetical protein Aduo_016763 [Ancylostoma duodenale]
MVADERLPLALTVCHTPLPIMAAELRLDDDGDVQDSLTARRFGERANSFRPMNGRQAPPLRANTRRLNDGRRSESFEDCAHAVHFTAAL